MNTSPHPAHPFLVVDDEEGILLAIDTTLRLAGFNNILTCNDSRDVMDILSKNQVEVILMDLNMPHIGGEDMLSEITGEYPEIPVIIVTGVIDVGTAVNCMRTGAFDYVVKPVEEDRLITTITRALEYRDLKRENLALKEHILTKKLENPEAFHEIITNNKKMLSMFQYIESIAPTSQAVLITGETGVGKELIARAIHSLSNVKGNLVNVNVAGLDDNVFSDTLFGHIKGAFTGADRARAGLIEQASGGTLFLDEIGDLNNASQVKLLRLLQEGEFLPIGQDTVKTTDARIIAATNEDLFTLQKEGRFRKDLNFRLRTHHIHNPPLRDRMGDIPLLVEYFLEHATKELNKKKPMVPKELITLLETYYFPGNIRELQAMVFDALSRHKSGILSLGAFKSHISKEQEESFPEEHMQIGDGTFSSFERLPTLKQATRMLVEEALKRSNSNQTIAARILGISQQALSKRMKKAGEK